MTTKSGNSLKKIVIIVCAIGVCLGIGFGAFALWTIKRPIAVSTPTHIYITPNTTYSQLKEELNQHGAIANMTVFDLVANRMALPSSYKTGRYRIDNSLSVLSLIRMLRSGNQDPVKLTFNNMRTKENLAGRLSQQLMADSTQLLAALNDSAHIASYGLTNATIVAMFIPNTYEVYWDTSVDKLMDRMHKEYTRFWTNDRLVKAKALGLSPAEVSTLASIVEEEATYKDEYPIVAGLYLNRLRLGMKLEADPTVKFAVGDFSLRRILFKHLEVESPYNTYKHIGLPPGPIRVPSIAGIDAVLSPTSHDYLFMCAKDNLSGRHNFARTHAEHSRNARAYQHALNARKIY